MSDFPKRKVFISWSKRPTDEVASAFANLLKHMFDNVQPWVSRDDIELGTLSIAEIHKELSETSFGVLMVTRRNQSEPWLNFEAGSLAKTVVDGGGTRVIPLLLDMDNAGQLDQGPLANLQAEPATPEGVKKLIHLIGVTVGANRDAIDARWEAAWEAFSAVLEAARVALAKDEPAPKPRQTEDILEELLQLTRRNARRPVPSRPTDSVRDLPVVHQDTLGPGDFLPIILGALTAANVQLVDVSWGRDSDGTWTADVFSTQELTKTQHVRARRNLLASIWPAPIKVTLPLEGGVRVTILAL